MPLFFSFAIHFLPYERECETIKCCDDNEKRDRMRNKKKNCTTKKEKWINVCPMCCVATGFIFLPICSLSLPLPNPYDNLTNGKHNDKNAVAKRWRNIGNAYWLWQHQLHEINCKTETKYTHKLARDNVRRRRLNHRHRHEASREAFRENTTRIIIVTFPFDTAIYNFSLFTAYLY